MHKSLPVIMILLGSALWGLTWLPLKAFNNAGIEGMPLIIICYGSVALVMSVFLIRERRVWRTRWPWLLLIALLGGYANMAFANAIIYGEVVRAMLLFYMGPVWGVLGGRIFFREHIDRQRMLGVILAMAGVWLILGGESLFATAPSILDFLALSAGFFYAMNNIAFRARPDDPVGGKLAASFTGCTIFAVLLLPALDQTLPQMSAGLWLGLLGFGLLWLLAATATTQWAVSHMEAGRASILLISELLVAAVSATLIGGETLNGRESIGAVLIIASAVLEAWRPATASQRQTA